MIDIQEILIQIGQTGTITAGSVFILKKYLELNLSKDLERFKSDLEKSSIEFKVRYEKLHTERAEVIKNLYQKISRLQSSLEASISPIQNNVSEITKNQCETTAMDNASEMFKYYNENRIFFEEPLAQEIDKLIDLFIECWRNFQLSQSMSSNEIKECSMVWGEAWDKLTKTEIPATKKSIENKFRSIIGINEELGKVVTDRGNRSNNYGK